MRSKVLVLNQDYTALTLCSVQRAFLLLRQFATLVGSGELLADGLGDATGASLL